MLSEHLISFPSFPSPSSPATFIKSISMVMHTSVDFPFFDFLCLMLFSSLPLQSPTLDPGLCHYLWPPGKKKKGKKTQISILCPSSWLRPWSLRLDFICHHLLSDPHFSPLCQHLQILCFKSLSLYKSTKTPTNWVLCNVSLLTPPSQHFLHSTLYSISVPQHGMPSLSPSLWNTSTQHSPCFIHPHGWTQAHICTHRYTHTLHLHPPSYLGLKKWFLGLFWWSSG